MKIKIRLQMSMTLMNLIVLKNIKKIRANLIRFRILFKKIT